MLKEYYELTKPGIIYGNAITAAGGFFLASRGVFDFWLLLAMLGGLSLIIASGCVFNNLIDRDIDSKMARTKNRALVTGAIPAKNAIIFGTALGIGGLLILHFFTTSLATTAAAVGFFVYVVVYGFFKRRSIYGTHVGSIAGAVPPVVGYCAASNTFDAGAIILFLILCLWQMPHFFSIAIYRLNDYTNAGLPVLPVKKGVAATKKQIVTYVIVFAAAIFALSYFGYVGLLYLLVMTPLTLYWLYIGFKGFKTSDDNAWARKMFGISLIVITAFSIIISVDPLFKW